MVMNTMRKGAAGGLGKIILFGFLGLAVGGLVFMDMGNFFTGGGVSRTDVARVGDEKIALQEFDRNVRSTISRIGLSPQEAYQAGYIQQLLSQEIRGRVINQAAHEFGIRVGNGVAAKHIRDLIAPMTSEGTSYSDTLKSLLRNQGMTETQFIASIKRDIENSLLVDALQGPFNTLPDAFVDEFYRFQNEKRDIRYILFPDSEITPEKELTDEALNTYFENIKERYAVPELRNIQIITINDSALKKTLDITDEELRAEYDRNKGSYTANATWTITQAILNTEDQAKAVYDEVAKDKSLSDAVEDVTGSEQALLEKRAYEENDLSAEIKQAVIDYKKKGEIIGPVTTPLGYIVAVVHDNTAAHTRTYDEVKTELREEFEENRLIDHLYDMANAVDDLLASGSSLEDVKEQVDVKIENIEPMTVLGRTTTGEDALEEYGEGRSIILESALNLLEGETSPVFETPDGKFRAVSVQTVIPKSYPDIESVKDEITKQWIQTQRHTLNRDKITKLVADAESLQSLAKAENKSVRVLNKAARQDTIQAPLTQQTLANLFEAPLNTPVYLETENGYGVFEVIDFAWPQDIDRESETYRALKENLVGGAKNEVLGMFLNHKIKDYGVSINERLLNQVYGDESNGQ